MLMQSKISLALGTVFSEDKPNNNVFCAFKTKNPILRENSVLICYLHGKRESRNVANSCNQKAG